MTYQHLHLVLGKKKKREFDLLQCYVSNLNSVIPICTAHLPLDLQSFIMTLSLSLGLHLLGHIQHSPMRPIPNLNVMVELAPRVEANNKGEGNMQGKL